MGAAKLLTGLGALALLLSGSCFLFVSGALGDGGNSTLSTIVIVLFVGGVLCAIAFLGLVREGRP